MNIDKQKLTAMLKNDRFPRSARYDPEWVLENNMGPNALWLTEWLCEKMDLKPGMRVLDMGCGKCLSSVFLAREFGVQVWANDLWISATENWQRIKEAGLEDRIFPVHAEAHELPYAEGFFDAIVSVDSYHYYGADDLYFRYFRHFVRPGGQIGIAVPGLMRDFDGPVPEYLTKGQPGRGTFWAEDCWSFHTVKWWRNLWERTGRADIEVADTLPDGWKQWLQFVKACADAGARYSIDEIDVHEADRGEYLGFVRMIARRKEHDP